MSMSKEFIDFEVLFKLCLVDHTNQISNMAWSRSILSELVVSCVSIVKSDNLAISGHHYETIVLLTLRKNILHKISNKNVYSL